MEEIRTRFAPSPTGFMHIGNLRSTLFEYLIAKALKGKFILRIEDTDQKRKVEGAVDFIYDTLNLCGFNIDEGPLNGGEYGPYVQSERLDLYKKYAHQLVEKGEAYYCFCSEERLDKLRKEAEEEKIAFMYDKKCLMLTKEEADEKVANGEKYVIRQNVTTKGTTSYTDLVYGKIEIENRYIEDQILLKSDGYPTYNFANVVDDHLMNITHVVRGNEYLSSTPKYNLLYKSFGWEEPTYVHLPHVNGSDGKKLSKRNGDASFMDLYEKGYLPEAIINYLALLGWSSKDNKEIFSLEELIEVFDVSRINKSGAIYDVKKLNWINSHYIKELSFEKLRDLVFEYLNKEHDLSKKEDKWIHDLILLYQKELNYGEEIVEKTKLFFEEEVESEEETNEIMSEDGVLNTLAIFKNNINIIDEWNVDNISNAINKTKEEAGVKGKMLYMPIRIKTTGIMHGPELPMTLYLLGKNKLLKRL